MRVQLLRLLQTAQLQQTREGRRFERRLIELNSLEDALELKRSPFRIPLTFEARHVSLYFFKRHTIASVVRSTLTIRHVAAWERIADDIGDLAHGIILRFVSDVEGLSTHRLP